MKTPTLKTLAAAVMATASLGAIAAPADYLNNVYGGASIGAPRYENSVNGITGHGSGASGKLFGGYQFSPNFALEAGYADLGRINNAGGSTHYYEVTSVGGLLNGETVSGSGYNTCLAIGSGNTTNANVTISTSSSRYSATITPATLGFLVVRTTGAGCATISNYYEGNATLTVG